VAFVRHARWYIALTHPTKIDSFEAPLLFDPKAKALTNGREDFVGVFIRAPVCSLPFEALSLLTADRSCLD